ncbi:MAG: diguanylate cyclase [Herbaspirillum sp.]|jgi:diguanylate cyclase (GGDEF)-like protein|nr:diguanylate cyclase [Herbaspirillum sp.]
MKIGNQLNLSLCVVRPTRIDRKLRDKLYRVVIYGLLAVLIGSGIYLSYVMTRTARNIRAGAVPQLEENVTLLGHISSFESALLRHQLAVNKYFSESIDRDRFLELQQGTQLEMDEHLKFVAGSLGTTDAVRAIRSAYGGLNDAPFSADARFMLPGMHRLGAQQALFNLNLKINYIRDRLDQVKQDAETKLYRSEGIANTSIYDITLLIYVFSTGVFLTGLFMIYHVWARFRLEDELAFQATHDPLTGLAHRRSFEAKLGKLTTSSYTIVLGRIDRFERVIGGLGHALGDRMMQQIATRIKQVAELHGGEAFRLDGANIAILYKLVKTNPALLAAVSEMRDAMRQPFILDRHEIFSSISLGAAEYPADASDPVQLLKNADAALRTSHDAGGDGYEAYTGALNTRTKERLSLEAALSHAIERKELELHYQPQQCLKTGKLTGFETLIRWRREDKLISPGDFIPLAEESGLIVDLGDWVFARACRQAKKWCKEIKADLLIAVNISPRQFRHPHFLQKITDTLRQTQVDPANIELEITEGMVMEGADRMIALLTGLRQLGLKLAIDDFGTGYSSLSYLTRFPVNRLKIDQSFVSRLHHGFNDVSIVQAAIQLGHNLGMEVIAEGVESESQRQCLKRLSCDQIQGYYYGRPLTLAAATEFLLAHRGDSRFNPVRSVTASV